MGDPSGSTIWTYDPRGRMASETKTITGAGTFKTQWTYNSADQAATMTYPGGIDGSAGETVTTNYNSQGLVTRVFGADSYLFDATYDAAGRVTTRKYGPGSAPKLESFSYHSWNTNLGLLKQHTVAGLLDLSYPEVGGYDANGNILKIVDNTLGQTQTFTYDSINRLASAKACLSATPATCDYNDTLSAENFYQYDAYGRLTTKPGSKAIKSDNITWGSAQLQYGDSNHIHAVTGVKDVNGNLTSTTYAYDNNGNMVARNNVDGKSYTLGYDVANRLATVSGGASASFVYDGDGQRVKGTVGGVTTVYLGDYYEIAVNQLGQLASNPSFDTRESGGGATNWTAQTSPQSLFPATSYASTPPGLGAGHSGTYGQTISNLAYGALRSDAIAVLPNTAYDLRAYVRGQIDAEGSIVGWRLRALFYDASNNSLGQNDVAVSKTITESWQQVGGVLTTPANTAKLRIELGAIQVSGWVAFDDVSLVQVGVGTNKVTNGGFETTSGTQAANWSTYDETGGKFPATGYYRAGDEIATARTGSFAYAISNLAYSLLQSDLIAVERSTEYDLYAYMRGGMTRYNWVMRVSYYSVSTGGGGGGGGETDVLAQGGAEVEEIGPGGMVFNSVGAPPVWIGSASVVYSSTLSATWQQRGGRIMTPYVTPSEELYLKIELYATASGGWVAFDDVSLVKVGGSGTNLASNPGFETQGSDISQASGWTKISPAAGSFPATSAWRGAWGVAAPHAGSYAYASGNLAYGQVKSSVVTATGNAPYDLKVWVQGYRSLSTSWGTPVVRVVALDSANNPLTWPGSGANYLDLISTGIANSAAYQAYGGYFVPPSGTTKVSVELLGVMMNGWVVFDDVALTPAATKYYSAGGQRIARRAGLKGVEYLFSDHLGSSSLVTDSSFNVVSRVNYTAWGKLRSVSGAALESNAFGYTGQRQEAGIGLNFYKSRWYDPMLGRFAQADTMVPDKGNPQGLDRYAFVANNPVKFIDPGGHCWGIFSFVRGLPSYSTTCNNLDMALTIITSDQTTFEQRLGASAYVVGEGGAHGLALVGSAACISNVGLCVSGAKTALGVGGTLVEAACVDGNCGNEVTAVQSAIQKGIDAVQNGLGTGYQSFEAFKDAQGGAGTGWAWHHIVTKLEANITQFGKQMIHNTMNLIRLPEGAGSLHRQLTSFYASINPQLTGSDTMRVRDWLTTLSFEEQWKFGIELIRQLGGEQYIIDKFK